MKEIKEIPVEAIKVGALRAFCVKIGLKGQGRATNKKSSKIWWSAKHLFPLLLSKKLTVKNPVNRYRFAKVLVGDIVQPLLNERGESLIKEDLTAGKLGDQDVFETVAIK